MVWRLRGDGREQRRAFAIAGYVGLNGHGKTLAMVHDTLPSLDQGRQVISTVPILGENGEPHPLYSPLTDWRQLLEVERCDVLLDEVTGAADSRASSVLPLQVRHALFQLRKKDVTVRYTVPDFDAVDKTLRRVSQALTYCRGGWSEPIEGQAWRSNRLFLWATYNARLFDHLTPGARARLRPELRELYWRPGKVAERSYDSSAAVGTLGHQSSAETCLNCGGHRPRPRCKCPAVEVDQVAGVVSQAGSWPAPNGKVVR